MKGPGQEWSVPLARVVYLATYGHAAVEAGINERPRRPMIHFNVKSGADPASRAGGTGDTPGEESEMTPRISGAERYRRFIQALHSSNQNASLMMGASAYGTGESPYHVNDLVQRATNRLPSSSSAGRFQYTKIAGTSENGPFSGPRRGIYHM